MIAEAATSIGLAGLIYYLIRRFLPARAGEYRPAPTAAIKRPTESAIDRLFAEAEEGQLRAGRLNEAELKFLEVARLDPHYPKLYNRMGIVYLEVGEYQKAVESFEHAVLSRLH